MDHKQIFLVNGTASILACDTSGVSCPCSVTTDQLFPNFYSRQSLLAAKNTHGYSHPCLCSINIERSDDGYSKLNIYISNYFRQLRIQPTTIRNNTLHDLSFIKMSVAHCEGTGSFLIRCFNGRTK